MMSVFQYGMICAIVGALGGAWMLAEETIRSQGGERIEHPIFGVVRRSRRPRLFHTIVVLRWAFVATVVIGAFVMARLDDLISRLPPISN